jgi:hypothetical protein
MRRAASLLVALAVAACSEDASRPVPGASASPAPKAASVLEPGAFRPGSTPAPVGPPAVSARSVSAHPPVALAPVRVSVVRLAAAQGEDGHGHTVAAVRPAAIDLETEGGWHAGGLATTLTVGDLRFHDMGYPSVTTMRFIVADEGALPRDVEVALEAGGTPFAPAARRRVVAPSLPVTR